MAETEKGETDSTEQRIFDAAHAVFMQKGMDGAKMQEIADKAGINKALLHYYYRSKEKLYGMVAKAVMDRAIPVIRQLLESDDPLDDKIRRLIDFYIEILHKNPFIPVFIITEINKHPQHFFDSIMPKDLPRPEVFFRQVEEASLRGEIRPVRPQHLIINILAMCIFPVVGKPMIRVILGMNGAELKMFFEERKEEVTQFVFAALRPEEIK